MNTGKKILVVDDDRVILTFASKLLTREGHEVITAGDGFEALNVLVRLHTGHHVLRPDHAQDRRGQADPDRAQHAAA
ncbi:MAG: hypothetical protein MZV70_46075 [Desulfobacterales bacterium]|nr:hypothetical protein [Desulfobacterales bacterium]